jgi:phospholipase C
MRIDALTGNDAISALDRIEHIVVLMLENRSFDHMLGYLSLGGRDDVNGLRPGLSNTYSGTTYPIHHAPSTASKPYQDPSHTGSAVKTQIAGGAMGGFVQSYVESINPAHRAEAIAETDSYVMGYFEGSDLPTYDHLAEHFCICDSWFASVPGATWPNRLYSIAGESGGRVDNKRLFNKFDFPFFALPSFVRHLDDADVSWRWYHWSPSELEPPTLQLVDPRYLLRPGEHFALVHEKEPITGQPSFVDDARAGKLPSVSWLDPNFYDTVSGPQNDDHPPTDAINGQHLTRLVANAMMSGPQWEKSMLVVLYDEHGGFYDHVAPPAAADDRADFRSYGVRVPSMVVSPYVEARSVSSVTYDHTSLIKTILTRFCRSGETVPSMGARVDAAEHLGGLLTATAPRAAVPVPELATPLAPAQTLRAATEAGGEGSLGTLRSTPAHHLADVVPGVLAASDESEFASKGMHIHPNDLQLGLAAMAGELREARSR